MRTSAGEVVRNTLKRLKDSPNFDAALEAELVPLLEAGEEMKAYYRDLLGSTAAGSIALWEEEWNRLAAQP